MAKEANDRRELSAEFPNGEIHLATSCSNHSDQKNIRLEEKSFLTLRHLMASHVKHHSILLIVAVSKLPKKAANFYSKGPHLCQRETMDSSSGLEFKHF
mgnify:CR=1 FL=1